MTPLRRALLLGPLLLTGCVSAQATMLSTERYAPVPAAEVALFLQEREVPAECRRIALIHTEADPEATSRQQMISAARRRAGKVGANALLLDELRDPGLGTRIASVLIGIDADRTGRMTAFRCPATSVVASHT